jgi:predicted MPP superfamily phosphohydrolase
VVNTGDNLSHVKAVDPLLDALKPLLQFPGVFVPGSNDYFAPSPKNPASYLLGPSKAKPKPVALDWPRLRSGFGMSGWVDLTNRHQSLVLNGMRFDFSGVDDPHLNRERYAGWPRGTVSQDAKDHLRIAVIHAPYQRVLDHFTESGADLLLAGHTRRPAVHPRVWRPRGQLRPPHLAGEGPQRLDKQRKHDAGQRVRRHRHLTLRPGKDRLQTRGRPADPYLPQLNRKHYGLQ